MSYQCELIQQTLQPTLAVRTRTSAQDLPALVGQTYGAIAAYLGQLGQYPAGPPYAAYYNMDMQDLDVELGFPVAKELPGKDDIKASRIPGGRFAAVLHTGPYDKVSVAYEALARWMTDKGYQATGVAYEVYLNDPGQTKPEDLQTRVMMPLR